MDVLKDAVGDQVRLPGQPRDTTTPRKNNGISGDARRSSKELGERLFKMRVEYATRQINRTIAHKSETGSRCTLRARNVSRGPSFVWPSAGLGCSAIYRCRRRLGAVSY